MAFLRPLAPSAGRCLLLATVGCLSHSDIGAAAPTPTQNLFARVSIPVIPGITVQGQAAVIEQGYADRSVRRYLLLDLPVLLPNGPLQLRTALEVRNANIVARWFRAAAVTAYAECRLEARLVQAASATFSLGLKSVGDGALIRWGVCQNPADPGYHSVYPEVGGGDRVEIAAANGQTLARFTLPAPAAVAAATAAAQNAVITLLSGSQFKAGP